MSSQYLLYQTLGCHLCELAEDLLMPHVASGDIQVELLEIADDDGLMERYGLRIPVLVSLTDGRELPWPFGEEDVASFIVGR